MAAAGDRALSAKAKTDEAVRNYLEKMNKWLEARETEPSCDVTATKAFVILLQQQQQQKKNDLNVLQNYELPPVRPSISVDLEPLTAQSESSAPQPNASTTTHTTPSLTNSQTSAQPPAVSPSPNTKDSTQRINSFDYRAWDKFDVDKALNQVDSSPTSTPKVVSPIDKKKEAESEKEKGNDLFRKGKYWDAIQHYTNAMTCDPKNPVYPANRAQCYLNLEKYKQAESDSSIALNSDPDFTKALFRRALARKFLHDYSGALSDLDKLVTLEPGNKQALQEVKVINGMTAAKLNSSTSSQPQAPAPQRRKVEVIDDDHPQLPKQVENTKPELSETPKSHQVPTITPSLPPATGNPAPAVVPTLTPTLPPTPTVIPTTTTPETHATTLPTPKLPETSIAAPIPLPTPEESRDGNRKTPLLVEEVTTSTPTSEITVPPKGNISKTTVLKPTVNIPVSIPTAPPRNPYEFQTAWSSLQGVREMEAKFLLSLDPTALPKIFQDSLGAELFTKITSALNDFGPILDVSKTAAFLGGLINVRRINMLLMFLSAGDKAVLSGLFKKLEEAGQSLGPLKQKFKVAN
ncbi:RNA polymerase II-associated protein 3 [Pelomyxa schiedti]|nr:RNA polymerase II-associated protein 3 [Pelomyxa schiedti]